MNRRRMTRRRMMNHPDRCALSNRRPTGRLRIVAPGAMLLLACCMTGCGESTGRSISRSSGGSGDINAMIQDVESHAIIGPRAARDLGYRVAWISPGTDSHLRLIIEEADSVFTLDDGNFLTRMSREDGRRIWRIPVGKAIDDILGITYVAAVERVYVTIGGSMLVLDSATGSQVGRQHLDKIANTAPIHAGQFLIYGSRNGQLIWHAFDIGYPWRAYEVAPTIQIPPQQHGGIVVAVGADGRIIALRINSATQVWDKRLLDSVVVPPVVGDQAVYVAGLDQHVWALDLANGRNIWRYLAEGPLTDRPVLLDDKLLQQVPGEGLVCFEALPIDAPGGRVMWRAGDVVGNAVSLVRSNLLVWDGKERMMTVVDPSNGVVIRRVSLERVAHLVRPDPRSHSIIVASEDGRLVRLVPVG